MLATGVPADGEAIFNGVVLNEALDSLRLHVPLRVRCGDCEIVVAFAALHPLGAYVVSGNRLTKPKKRRGGSDDLVAITPLGPGTGFVGWDADARAGKGSVTPTGERAGVVSGFPERRTHRCRKCHRRYTLTNSSLLRLYLAAIARGDGEIRLY